MSEVKWTQGPWNIEYGHMQDQVNIRYWQITDGQDAICCNQFCCASDSEGNANLIAAAPDLYEALENQLKNWIELIESGDAGFWNPDDDEHVIAMRKVLAKARGEHK